MSIRIHELAAKIGKPNKELMALLKERKIIGADVKSPSSTISDIYADYVAKEFGVSLETAPPAPAAAPPPPPAAETPAPEPPKLNLPAGVFVKSAQDIVREKEVREAAAKAAATALRSPPVMLTPRSVAPPPPRAPAPPAAPRLAPPVSFSKPAPAVPPPLRPAAATLPVPALKPAPSSPPGLPPVAKSPAALPPRAPLPATPPRAPSPSPVVMPVLTRRPGTDTDVRLIQMKPPIIVRDLAAVLGVKPFKLINEVTQATGGFASMNSSLDEAVAAKIAESHGFILEVKHRGETVAQTPQDKATAQRAKAEEEEAKNLAPRPPVVCILGHVDHGKTSLLDAIRKAAVAAGEAGGITQHIGAYQIEHNGKKITFLDTPGHAAFNKMRARGAAVTDIAVLVVAADDGFMLQTDEALKHAQTAAVALMVAVNKMDVKGANLDRVKQQMQERNIAPEDWGGETITVPVSALKGTGLTDLLDMILLQADVLELKANPKAPASGVVIESQVDVGRGPLATVIVQRGTLRVGDALVCGPHWCKVRALYDDQGASVKEAVPATPVRIIGWSGTPDAGAAFTTAKNAREAEKLAEAEQQTQRQDAATAIAAVPQDVSVEQLFANIAAEQKKTLKVIVKTDVFGSAEAVRQLLEGIKSAKVSLEVLSSEVGLVTKNDVLMAGTGGAIIIGFNTKLENGVTPLAKHHGVRIESFTIIYELADKVREMMADLLDPDLKETKTGAAEVRATFPQGKGFVAGCLVTEGRIARNSAARLRRKKEVVHEGKIATLKRFKDDANEVRAGLECGIKLGDFNGYEPGDIIECYEVAKVRASL